MLSVRSQPNKPFKAITLEELEKPETLKFLKESSRTIAPQLFLMIEKIERLRDGYFSAIAGSFVGLFVFICESEPLTRVAGLGACLFCLYYTNQIGLAYQESLLELQTTLNRAGRQNDSLFGRIKKIFSF